MKIPAQYRKYTYIFAAAVLGIGLVAGIVTPEQIDSVADNATKIAGLLAALLALANVTPDQ